MTVTSFWRARVAGVFVAVVAGTLLAACAADDACGCSQTTTTLAAVAPNGETVSVQVLDNSFRPETLEIAAGTEVVFDNRGRNDHNVLPADPSLDWGVQALDFKPGDTYTYVFATPGEYHYFCSIHGTADAGMIGTIIVSAV
ncbi:hypothetical protein BH10ACT2_BH10ACT2_15290 [soil metagenome]